MSKEYCFGVDIGGTTVKIGLFTQEGTLLEKWEIPTRKEEQGKYVLEDTARSLIEKIEQRGIKKEQVSGVGVGVPGPVIGEEIVNVCVNIGWGVINVAEEIKRLTGFQVKVSNDANVAALGELWQGGGKGYRSIVLIPLGTGVGGGVVLGEEIISGCAGAGGEIGHMIVNPKETATCTCHRHGCLEQYASATGIVRLAKLYYKDYKGNTVLKEENLTAKDVLDGAKSGDSLAEKVMEEVFTYLGLALSNVSSVVDPEAFVIGGGVSKAGAYLMDGIKEKYEAFAFHASKNKTFTIALLGNDAGMYGSAKLILDFCKKDGYMK